MSVTLTTFLFEVANFLVLAALLGWLFFKPVRQSLVEYRARLDALAHDAAEQLATATQAQTEVEAERQALHSELTQLHAQTLERARQEAEAIVAQARLQAQRLQHTAQQQVKQLEATQLASLSEAAAAAAGTVVDRLLREIDTATLDTALYRVACEEVRKLTLEAQPLTVESAAPLSEDHRAMLDAALGPAATAARHLVVPALGAGVRITTSHGVIDTSIQSLAAYAQQALRIALEQRAVRGVTHGA